MNIFGKYVDEKKEIKVALGSIYGLGSATITEVLMCLGIGSKTKVKDLSKEQWAKVVEVIEKGIVCSKINSEDKKNTQLVGSLPEWIMHNKKKRTAVSGVYSDEFGISLLGVNNISESLESSSLGTEKVNEKSLSWSVKTKEWLLNLNSAAVSSKNQGFVSQTKLTQSLCEAYALAKIREKIETEKKIKSYRGFRHMEGLPVHGQRTHTNAITAKKRRSKMQQFSAK